MLPRYLLVTMVILGGIHSAHAHGIAGNRFFPGTLSFDDPAVADEAIVPNFAGFKRPVDGGNLSITDSIGRFSVFLLRRSALMSPARGFTGTWAILSGRDLMGSAWASKARSIVTISMRCWCQRDWDGVSGAQGPKESAPMHPTRCSLGFFSAKVSVIFQTSWHGCGRSALLVR